MISGNGHEQRLLREANLSPDLAALLFSQAFDPGRPGLYAAADRVRREVLGDDVYLRGLIEFSNFCTASCDYCGISTHNARVDRYRMSVDEVLQTLEGAVAMGYRSFVLQSGEDPGFPIADLCRLIETAKSRFEVAITLSVGEYSRADYAALRQAGADRFLLRIETSDPALFARFHPHASWERRHRCLMDLKDLGYQVGSGILVGLPGQDSESLRRDLAYLVALRPEMVGIGPFIPHPDTPLAAYPGGRIEDCLTFLALLRLSLPDAFLPATTAMGSIDPQGRQKALQAGANVLMPNVSPMANREKYQLYPGKICLTDDASACRHCMEAMVAKLGRTVNLGQGHIKRSVF